MSLLESNLKSSITQYTKLLINCLFKSMFVYIWHILHMFMAQINKHTIIKCIDSSYLHASTRADKAGRSCRWRRCACQFWSSWHWSVWQNIWEGCRDTCPAATDTPGCCRYCLQETYTDGMLWNDNSTGHTWQTWLFWKDILLFVSCF